MSRRARPQFLALIVTALVLTGCGSSAKQTSTTATEASSATSTQPATTAAATQPEMGFEDVPIEQGAGIAPASTTRRDTVDGIQCAPLEQLEYHIHAHLLVYDNGQPRSLPGGIGIPGSEVENLQGYGPVALVPRGGCYYWLHTHAPDGVIHIESPTKRIYTLGNFFDEWHQPLSRTTIGTIHGTQAWSVNGKPWRKSPRDIPLLPHADIQVSVGLPLAPYAPVNWKATHL